MARHRHVVNVRADGIAVVLGPLLSDARIAAAALVDVDSGMVLDAWSAAPAGVAPDLELIGAQHAEIVRNALALLRTWPDADGPEADTCEVVLGADGGCRHLLRTVPDPHGDRLALAVVVDGPPRMLERVRKRLRSISVDALTAGPSMIRRPVLGGWSFAMPKPDVPASPERPMVRHPDPGPAEAGLPGPDGVAPADGALRDLVAVEAGQSGPDGSTRPDGVRRPDGSLPAEAAQIPMPQIPMPPIPMPQIPMPPVPMPGPRDARTAPERPTPAAASRPAAAPPAGRTGPAGPRPPSPPAALPTRAPSRPPRS